MKLLLLWITLSLLGTLLIPCAAKDRWTKKDTFPVARRLPVYELTLDFGLEYDVSGTTLAEFPVFYDPTFEHSLGCDGLDGNMEWRGGENEADYIVYTSDRLHGTTQDSCSFRGRAVLGKLQGSLEEINLFVSGNGSDSSFVLGAKIVDKEGNVSDVVVLTLTKPCRRKDDSAFFLNGYDAAVEVWYDAVLQVDTRQNQLQIVRLDESKLTEPDYKFRGNRFAEDTP